MAEIAALADIRPDIARYLTRGELISLPEDAFGACARLLVTGTPVFERGWDSEARPGGQYPDRSRSGFERLCGRSRDGMKILRRTAGEPGNSAVDYVRSTGRRYEARSFHLPSYGPEDAAHPADRPRSRFASAAEPEKCKAALAG